MSSHDQFDDIDVDDSDGGVCLPEPPPLEFPISTPDGGDSNFPTSSPDAEGQGLPPSGNDNDAPPSDPSSGPSPGQPSDHNQSAPATPPQLPDRPPHDQFGPQDRCPAWTPNMDHAGEQRPPALGEPRPGQTNYDSAAERSHNAREQDVQTGLAFGAILHGLGGSLEGAEMLNGFASALGGAAEAAQRNAADASDDARMVNSDQITPAR